VLWWSQRPAALVILLAVPLCNPAWAACNFDVLKQGRVAAVIDEQTFRLEDGQEVRLAGIVPLGALRRVEQNAASPSRPDTTALAKLLLDHDVTLRGPTAKPDRYGRLIALASTNGSSNFVQSVLLDEGRAAFSGDIADSENKDCVSDLLAREAVARRSQKGFWADTAAIKNTERPGDILPWIGRFVVAEGKIESVREAGGTVYINFGRRWTRDFAVTISRRIIRRFEAWGIVLKTLESRTVRVRGWVEQRGGPRVEALGPGQIEVVGDR
jgi:endonuclease YncB( thermonuclease family)